MELASVSLLLQIEVTRSYSSMLRIYTASTHVFTSIQLSEQINYLNTF